MTSMLSHEIRESFLAFFESRGHRRVASAALVPAEDPTLLFTNAGMVQFKGVFTGEEKRDYARATSSQRCLRAGGKHNDLERVGRTARHHTFFEMLGNFSFGDYFKEGAIDFAYDLLVREWRLDPGRLVYTVFKGGEGIAADDEARALWKKRAGVGDDRVLGLGMDDNFWAMGETGPCGPCSEILYHISDDSLCEAEAAGGKCAGAVCDCDRWIEIWNLVFMQYERDASGTRKPLPKPSIDTGMGLERVSAIVQGKKSNYDTDLMRRLIETGSDLLGKPYGAAEDSDVSLRVIADHIRASAFLIADGVYPSNEGRGYVLRRIMRRMIRHARLLGADQPVLHRLTGVLSEMMNAAHPVLAQRQKIIVDAIKREEETFLATLDRGMSLLDRELAGRTSGTLAGPTVFKLYDTYGFPPDLTAIITESRGVHADLDGFEKEMEIQRERSRQGSDFAAGSWTVATRTATDFLGYDALEAEATVLECGTTDDGALVILDRTPFYAESGGQIGDAGVIESDAGRFEVSDTKKTPWGVWVHFGKFASGSFTAGARVRCRVDAERRVATERHHTATHLLHAALFRTLGEHVQQAGSYVGPDRLRFDFSHFKAMTPEELEAVEKWANEGVVADHAVTKRILPIDDARKLGAKAFFGDKYGELVRVVSVEGETAYSADGAPVSREFCGGCHVRRTGEIGVIRIVSEAAIASGVRRLEAVTGLPAWHVIHEQNTAFSRACKTLSTPAPDFLGRLDRLIEERKGLEKELQKLRVEAALARADEMLKDARETGGVRFVPLFLPGLDPATLRDVASRLQQKLGEGVIIAGSDPADDAGERRAAFCVTVSKSLTAKIKAGDIASRLAAQCGGKGGGRPEIAQSGGKDAARVEEAVRGSERLLREMLGE